MTKIEKSNFEDRLYIYEAALEVLKAKIALINIEYSRIARVQGLNEIQKVTSRIKSAESISEKLKKDGLQFTTENIESKIHDVVGARIVCLTLNDVKTLIEITRKTLNRTEGFALIKEKDYINNPKESGYQSYHFQIEVPVTFSDEQHKVRAEIQARTMAMDAWATLEHKLGYKCERPAVAALLKYQFEQYASTVENTDKMIATVNAGKTQDVPTQKTLTPKTRRK